MNRMLPVLTLALALAVPACSRKSEEGTRSDQATMATGMPGRSREAFQSANGIAPAEAPPPAPAPAAKVAGGESAPEMGQAPPAPLPRMLIRTGTASIKVDSLAPAMRAVRALAQRVGAFVAGENIASGENEVRSGTLQLKIPSNRFDEALQALSTIGKVENVQVSAEDVGQEFVDVNARLENSKRLEERLLTLLQTRTGKLDDVLAVERELARVRETIERLTGRVQYLQRQVDVSTLTITVHEPAPITGTPGDSPIANAFRAAWRLFVGSIAFLIASLGILIPLAVLGGAAWWIARWWRRRQAQPAPKAAL